MEKQSEKVILSRAEFDDMYEYSTSVPSATSYGKVWKCNINAVAPRGTPEDWWMGEYVPDPKAKIGRDGKPETVQINWRKIEVEDAPNGHVHTKPATQ